MNELFPTKTRLALLRDVGRGTVLRFPNGESRQHFDDGTYTVINALIGELEQAGWVRVGGVETSGPYRSINQRARLWQLTRAGEAVLAAAARAAEAAEEALQAALGGGPVATDV